MNSEKPSFSQMAQELTIRACSDLEWEVGGNIENNVSCIKKAGKDYPIEVVRYVVAITKALDNINNDIKSRWKDDI